MNIHWEMCRYRSKDRCMVGQVTDEWTDGWTDYGTDRDRDGGTYKWTDYGTNREIEV